MARSNGAMGASVCGMMVMMMMIMGAAAQAPAPAPDCPTVVFELSDCLTFVTGQVTTPTATCCSNLSAVITNTPQCLCLLFNTTFTAPLGVNVTIAQQLPPACKLTAPPTSLCSLVGIPVSAPMSPATTPASSAEPSTAPASAPMAAVPMSSAPSPAEGSSPASSPAMTTAPAGSMGPAGTPPANSTTSPNSAPVVTSRNAAVAATLLFVASIFLS